MSLLYRLLSADDSTALTVVAPWSALLRRVLPRSELRGRVTHLERGMNVDRDALLQVLVSAGYHHTKLVEERGEVAARGGVIDIFPPQLEQPARVEFDFDAIASMRQFDPQTQRSSGALKHLVAIPAALLPHSGRPRRPAATRARHGTRDERARIEHLRGERVARASPISTGYREPRAALPRRARDRLRLPCPRIRSW